MSENRLNIAVVGAGVAGIGAANVLQRQHDVTLFERNDYVGGHTNTAIIPNGPDSGTPVDTGFIVLNERTYPTLHRFLAQLEVPVRGSNMSFSYYDEAREFYYNGSSFRQLFAQRRNVVSPRFWRMLRDVMRFNREALRDLQAGALEGRTLGDYVETSKYSHTFVDDYLYPMAAAIWSTAPTKMADFPAQYIVAFYHNHGLLELRGRPQWQTVIGGSQQYVKAFLRQFQGQVVTKAGIENIKRNASGISIQFANGELKKFDRVVLAAHADESLQLLADPSDEERAALETWRYERNHVALHSDESVMPPARRAWASWNYTRENQEGEERRVSLTYHMNQLQGLETERQYFVSVNRRSPIDPERLIEEFNYTHPLYTLESLRSQEQLKRLNGQRDTFFCGSYFGYGFHEDAIRSGVAVAKAMGLEL